MRHNPLSPEMEQQASRLFHRIELAYDLGAWALGYTDAVYDNDDTRKAYFIRLAKEQPDLFDTVARLEGTYYSIMVDGVPNFSEEI